jgi:chromosome segregation ATPase
MPREASITYEQVAACAAAILAGGGKPTSRALRAQLGRGSLGTIHRLQQQWQAGRQPAPEVLRSIPVAVERAIRDFAANEASLAKGECLEQLAESQAVANELAAENERQATQIAELHQEVFELQTDKATQAGRLAQLDTDLWTVREELAGERRLVAALRIELAKAQTRLEALLADSGARRNAA